MALTSEAILDAASEAFAARGYGEVALDDVAAAAGVTRGAVYHRYAGKRELFLDVLARVAADVAARVEAEADAAGADPLAQLEAGGVEFVRAAVSPRNARILLVDGPAVAGWDAWRDLDAHHSRRALEEALLALRDERPGTTLDPTPAAILLSGALNEAALWIATQPDAEAAIARVRGQFARLVRSLVDADARG